jgi:hypothetical protein
MTLKKILPLAVPWLGLLGCAVLVIALFRAPGAKLPEKEDSFEVAVSRRQIKDAVDAAVAENPSLRDHLDQTRKEMKDGAAAQALFVAEAFQQGLAADDYIVKNRLVEIQVMALYEKADAMVTPEAVEKYFAGHRDRYQSQPRRLYLHLFAPVTNLASDAEAHAQVEALFRDPAQWGEPKWVTEDDLRQAYGPTLAQQVFTLPRGQWSQAIHSDLGWHYLKVVDEEPARPYTLDEVRTRATEDCRRELREKMYQDEVNRLRKKYRVKETE